MLREHRKSLAEKIKVISELRKEIDELQYKLRSKKRNETTSVVRDSKGKMIIVDMKSKLKSSKQETKLIQNKMEIKPAPSKKHFEDKMNLDQLAKKYRYDEKTLDQLKLEGLLREASEQKDKSRTSHVNEHFDRDRSYNSVSSSSTNEHGGQHKVVEKRWACPSCTFENHTHNSRCTVCEGGKPLGGKQCGGDGVVNLLNFSLEY
jgi:hypothetical protein